MQVYPFLTTSDQPPSPLTLLVAPSFHVKSGSAELMRLLPGSTSRSKSQTSHISLLFERGITAVESALAHTFRGENAEVEYAVLRTIGPVRISVVPQRNVIGQSSGALLLFHPIASREESAYQLGSSGADFLDSANTVYEIDLHNDKVRFLSGKEQAGRYYDTSSLDIEAWVESLHPEDRDRVTEARHNLVRNGTPVNLKYRIRTNHSTYEWIHDRSIRVGDVNGRLFQIGITRFPLSEEEVEGKKTFPAEETRAILDATEEFYAFLEPDLTVRWANRAAEDLFGRPSKELEGRFCFATWQGRNDPCGSCPLAKAAATKVPQEADVQTPDGRTFHIRGYPLTDEEGTLSGLIEFGREITAERATEQRLRETAGLLESILENSPYPISVLDTEGNYVMVNQAMTKLYNRTREVMVGNHMTQFLSQETGALFMRRIRRLVKDKTAVFVEDEIQVQNSYSVFYTTLFPIWDNRGEIVAIGGIATDITELKNTQEQLERSDAQKAVLLQNVHNQIQKNLESVSSLITLTARSGLPPDRDEMLRHTQIRIRAMSLIHERVRETEEFAAIDLGSYAQQLVEEVIKTYDCGDRVSLSIWADSIAAPLGFTVSFGLILAELVSAACVRSFLPQGGGLLEVAISDWESSVVLRVADNGPGLLHDDGDSRLLVIEQLVEELGGSIDLDTSEGTTWKVILTLAPEDRASSHALD